MATSGRINGMYDPSTTLERERERVEGAFSKIGSVTNDIFDDELMKQVAAAIGELRKSAQESNTIGLMQTACNDIKERSSSETVKSVVSRFFSNLCAQHGLENPDQPGRYAGG